MQMLAIDLGKRSFHIHGVDADGVVVSRKVSRAKLFATVEALAPTTVAMEAGASAHHWGRVFRAAGRQVRLINLRFVTPFARGSKNDAVDAEAIYEAASRPNMRFVPVKTTRQQDLQSLHRVRDRLVSQRTALINHTRGLLAEYGVILSQEAARFATRAKLAIAESSVSALVQELFEMLLAQLAVLQEQINQLDGQILAICRENEACRRLAAVPGIGPLIAAAIVASVGDARQFRSGRELAAWIGLVPTQYTTGGKPRLGGIGRRANHYLRRQMIHGARAVAFRAGGRDDRTSRWLRSLIDRRGLNKATVALANKTARIAWALLRRQQAYVMPT